MNKTLPWTAFKVAAVAAAIAILFGVLALLIPVSVSHAGSKVGCGNALIRDRGPTESYLINHSSSSWGKILGYESRSVSSDSWHPSSACTDALTLRRWIAWVPIIGGVAAATFAFTRRPASGTGPRSQDPHSNTDHPTSTLVAERSEGTPQTIATRAMGAPSAGWYPDQVDRTRLRWFDGTRWTEATLPIPNTNAGPPSIP
ncbi:DUF2510 domain-containing protein [Rhodococcus sp. IEGM 1379]|uniref:DUF2510 domain-containing protein n=1 Tax=Rhodococcus sp. IEGM 1379 TaxID=3047086 RepID=UPI0024B85A25|nr:DUF2510 domain-containing protein [Rhodococcus sp. IEGM 1379]MDI9915408.1 DUF2510 domain-containing protein [Rhodococcus sp. IEGM 1379]